MEEAGALEEEEEEEGSMEVVEEEEIMGEVEEVMNQLDVRPLVIMELHHLTTDEVVVVGATTKINRAMALLHKGEIMEEDTALSLTIIHKTTVDTRSLEDLLMDLVELGLEVEDLEML